MPLPEGHLLGLAAALLLRRVGPATLPGGPHAHAVVGSTVCLAGAIVIARTLRAAGHVELDHPCRLLTAGPYALSRNPMYLGWTLLHVGVGVVSRSGWIVLTVPAAVTWIHREILREERSLAALFGDAFVEYREAVPRYFPRSRKRNARAAKAPR